MLLLTVCLLPEYTISEDHPKTYEWI